MTDVLRLKNGTILVATTRGVAASVDGGLHWSPRNEGLPSRIVFVLTFAKGTVLAGTSKGVFRSSEDLMIWTKTSLPDSTYRTLLTGAHGFLFAKAEGGELYASEDGGGVWKCLNVGVALHDQNKIRNTETILINGQGHLVFAFDSCSFVQSTDNGMTWMRRTAAEMKGGHLSRAALRDSVMMVASWEGGLARSLDNGVTWKRLATPSGHIGHIAIVPSGIVLLETYDPDRRYESPDSGRTWRRSSLPVMFNAFRAEDRDTILSISREPISLMRSTDGGLHWKTLTSSFGTPTVIAASPGGALFAGTDWEGAYKSRDFGLTWEPLLSASCIDRIAFASDSVVAIGTSICGLFATMDGGRTWNDAQEHGLPERHISAIAATHRGVFFAGTNSEFVDKPTKDGKGKTLGYKGGGLWRSIDFGSSWERVILDSSVKTTDNGETWVEYDDNGKRGSSYKGWDPDYSVLSIWNDPKDQLLVNAKAGYKEALFTTTNDGVTWTHSIIPYGKSEREPQFVKTDQGEIFSRMSRSTDGGKTFDAVVNGLKTGGMGPVQPVPGGDVLIATYGGVFCLPFHGNTWYCVGLDSLKVKCLCISGGYIFASVDYGYQDYRNGVYRTELSNLQARIPRKHVVEPVWREVARPFERELRLFTVDSFGVLWAVDDTAGMARSADGGMHWTKGRVPDEHTHALVADPTGKRLLAATYEGLFQSTTNGLTWALVPFKLRAGERWGPNVHAVHFTNEGTMVIAVEQRGPMRNPCADTSRTILSYTSFGGSSFGMIYRQSRDLSGWIASTKELPESPGQFFVSARGTMFTAVNGGGLYRSTDAGRTWNPANEGLLTKGAVYICNIGADLDRSVECMAMDSRGTLFAVRGGGNFYRSTNDGTTWEFVSGLAGTVSSLHVDVADEIFAATTLGVFCSSDEGKMWRSYSAGLTSQCAKQLAMHPSGRLFVATNDGRVFVSIRQFGSGKRSKD
jgi:photosystem II stability/assembly factor-like uncharacterized protein